MRANESNLNRFAQNVKNYVDNKINPVEDHHTVATFKILTVPAAVTLNVSNNVLIDWGDGSAVTSGGTHTYTKNGTFTCKFYDLKYIYNDMFKGCTSLTAIKIGNLVTEIRNRAFYNCTGLISVDIPDSVTAIGAITPTSSPDGAFFGCTSLESIVLPDSVTILGAETFQECTKLATVKLSDSIHTIGKNVFRETALKEIILPNTVTTLGSYAFYKCASLERVVLSNVLKEIGRNTFSYCEKLEEINLPYSLTTIGQQAFSNCSSLSCIIIPTTVTTLVANAFEGCTALTIYCEALSQPTSWDANWNIADCPVIWNYKQALKKLTKLDNLDKVDILDQLYYIKKLSLQKSIPYKKFQCTCNFIWAEESDEEDHISYDFSEDADVSVHLHIAANGLITISATATDYNQTRSVISGEQFYLTNGTSLGTTGVNIPITINTSGIVKLLPTENKCKINSVFYNKEKEASNISISSTKLTGTVRVTQTVTDEDDEGPSGGTAYYYISAITITWYEGIETDLIFDGNASPPNIASNIYPPIYSSGNETVIEYSNINEANSTYVKLV